jgi:PTH1 family peptidyl-tRNA hydrolase
MKLIVGLGNPGPKFEKTRHNLGFMAIDFVRDKLDTFSNWREEKAYNSLIAEGEIDGEKIILAKPQTFMNLSGQAVHKIRRFYKPEAADIWIIHDDFDLPIGVLRVSQGASAAGHNGIKSVIEMLGTKNFIRFRIGIHPIGRSFFSTIFKRKIALEKFVLEKFEKEELNLIDDAIKKCGLAVEKALKEGIPQAMNEFN